MTRESQGFSRGERQFKLGGVFMSRRKKDPYKKYEQYKNSTQRLMDESVGHEATIVFKDGVEYTGDVLFYSPWYNEIDGKESTIMVFINGNGMCFCESEIEDIQIHDEIPDVVMKYPQIFSTAAEERARKNKT